jgi:hypothetical protein
MAKTEVYSWRLSSGLKAELEEAAREEQKSMAELLDQIAREWLEHSRERDESEEEEQERLHAAARKCFGTIPGGDPYRAERASSEVRSRLARRYGR